MASNLRVDNIQPSTGTGIGIGTANGSVTFNADVTGGLNIATGSVGIGTTPEAFHSNNKGVIRGDGGYFILGRNTNDSLFIAQNYYYDSSDVGRYIVDGEASLYSQDNGEHVFYGAASGTAGNIATQQERARFTSNGLKFPSGLGIDFSATADGSGTATSELFDDYEEGTFTPVWGNTSAAYTGTTPTYTTQAGNYVKVGRLVYFDINLIVSAWNGSGSVLWIYGLPYATPSGFYQSGASTIFFINGGTSQRVCDTATIQLPTNNTRIEIYSQNAGTGANYGALSTGDVNEDALNIRVGGVYMTS